MTYGSPTRKTTLRKMMEEEEFLSKAANCPPGHTYNKNIGKCLPGSPLSGISYPNMGGKPKNPQNSGNSGENTGNSADMAIKQEAMMRKSQGLDANMQNL